jgi:hypothetical protein
MLPAANRKFSVQSDPLVQEKKIKVITPRAEEKEDAIFNKWLTQQKQKAYTEADEARKHALAMFELEHDAQKIDALVDQTFAEDFRAWLQGKGRPEDTKKTEWGCIPLDFNDVREYICEFIEKKNDYQKKIEKLKLRGPHNLHSAYLYFKYVIRGHPVPSMDYLQEFNDTVFPETKSSNYDDNPPNTMPYFLGGHKRITCNPKYRKKDVYEEWQLDEKIKAEAAKHDAEIDKIVSLAEWEGEEDGTKYKEARASHPEAARALDALTSQGYEPSQIASSNVFVTDEVMYNLNRETTYGINKLFPASKQDKPTQAQKEHSKEMDALRKQTAELHKQNQNQQESIRVLMAGLADREKAMQELGAKHAESVQAHLTAETQRRKALENFNSSDAALRKLQEDNAKLESEYENVVNMVNSGLAVSEVEKVRMEGMLKKANEDRLRVQGLLAAEKTKAAELGKQLEAAHEHRLATELAETKARQETAAAKAEVGRLLLKLDQAKAGQSSIASQVEASQAKITELETAHNAKAVAFVAEKRAIDAKLLDAQNKLLKAEAEIAKLSRRSGKSETVDVGVEEMKKRIRLQDERLKKKGIPYGEELVKKLETAALSMPRLSELVKARNDAKSYAAQKEVYMQAHAAAELMEGYAIILDNADHGDIGVFLKKQAEAIKHAFPIIEEPRAASPHPNRHQASSSSSHAKRADSPPATSLNEDMPSTTRNFRSNSIYDTKLRKWRQMTADEIYERQNDLVWDETRDTYRRMTTQEIKEREVREKFSFHYYR